MQRLTSDNFYVDDGKNGKLLCTTQKDLLFVFFYKGDGSCDACKAMMPSFQQLGKYVPEVKYAIINVDEQKDAIRKSLKTISPIKYVPYLILFVNNKPFLRYDGGKDLKDMINFLKDLLTRIPKNMLATLGSTASSKFDSEVPVFAGGGIPYNVVCDKNSGVCYLTFEDLKKTK